MKKVLCLALALLLLAACGAKEAPPESSSTPESLSSSATESNSAEEPPEIQEDTPQQEQPELVEQHRDEILAVVSETIAQYRDGTIETGIDFPVLPEDFTFPEDISGAEIGFNEVMGFYSVSLPSATSDWTGTFSCDNTVFVLADGSQTGGEFRVTHLTLRDGSGAIPEIPILPPDESVLMVVEMAVERYNATEKTPRDQTLPQPPEGFAFPAKIDWNSLPMTYDPAEAMYQVVIPSEDGSQKAVFRCKKWDGSEKGTGMANIDTITFE